MPVEAHPRDCIGRLAPQVEVHPALDDPEAQLAGRRLGAAAAIGPRRGARDGARDVVARGAARRALVEAHGDVRAERALDAHRDLGREALGGAVVDGAERDAVVVDPRRVEQREDLEAARVGEQGARPAHEAVQAAELLDQLLAGPQVQVVGVAEDDLRAERLELERVERLHRGLRADRHEDGGLDGAVRELERGGARRAVDGVEHEGAGRRRGRDARHREAPAVRARASGALSGEASMRAPLRAFPRRPRAAAGR